MGYSWILHGKMDIHVPLIPRALSTLIYTLYLAKNARVHREHHRVHFTHQAHLPSRRKLPEPAPPRSGVPSLSLLPRSP